MEQSSARRAVDLRALVAIAIGGALGAPARYGIAQVIKVPKNGFPWATFWTNVSGAFVLGLFFTAFIDRSRNRRYVRLFFAVGFLGAYTTYSTMAVETVSLVRAGRAPLGIAYVCSSVAVGAAVAFAGLALGRVRFR